MKKKVFVNGYADDNFGDDIFFDLLLNRYPETDFYFNLIHTPNHLKQYPNCKVVYKKKRDLLTFLGETDLYLLIGGSMFQESNHFLAMFKRWLKTLLVFLYLRFKGIKIVCIGFNFGPIRTKAFLQLYRLLFKIPTYLSVRDDATYQLFKKNPKFHYYPDMAFSLQETKIESDKTKSLGVSLMDFGPAVSFQTAYNQFMVSVLNEIDCSIPITIYGFQNTSKISDKQSINSVLQQVKRDVQVELYNGYNFKEFLASYGKNSYIITTRFHSLVLALLNQQNISCIEYNVKVSNLLNMLKLRVPRINVSDLNKRSLALACAKEINIFFKNLDLNQSTLSNTIDVEQLKDLATKHFEYLDKILN